MQRKMTGMEDKRSYFFDYTLEFTDQSRANAEDFWRWYRSDNALLGEVRAQLESEYFSTRVSQRVYRTIQGQSNTVLERIEVRGLRGIANFFLGLNLMKANIAEASVRLDEFYRWIEISRLQIRAAAPSFDRFELGDHKVFLASRYQYRHAARARPGDFCRSIDALDDAIKRAHPDVRGVQNYTDLVGAHWEYSRWIAFDDMEAASRYLTRGRDLDVESLLATWLEPLEDRLIDEVMAT